MPNRKRRRRHPATSSAELIAASFLVVRGDGLMDAIVSAAALVARADGWIEPVERHQLLDFLDRHGILSTFTRPDILDAFERRMRRLREPGGALAVLAGLRRYAGSEDAALVLGMGEEIAAADCRLDPREQQVLHLIRAALRSPALPAALNGVLPGAKR